MRTSKRNTVASNVFSLASNLFGGQKAQSDEFIQLPKAPENTTGRLSAIYPAIIQEAFAQTMDNYRKYVAGYNFQTMAENEVIDKFNAGVALYLKQNPLSEIQRKLIEMFRFRSKEIRDTRQYNADVDDFCQANGPIFPKQRIQTVKYGTEQVFSNLLHMYNGQLMKRNAQYMSLRVITPRPIQELNINAKMVTEFMRNGVKSLALCSKSVRNHRQRLEECGVLVDYHFQGAQRPVCGHVNPEILVVLDLKTNQLTSAENQHVTPYNGKVLPDNHDNTRSIIKENKRKVDHNRPDKEFAGAHAQSICFLQEHPRQEAISSGAAAAGDEKNTENGQKNTQSPENVTLNPDLEPLEGFLQEKVKPQIPAGPPPVPSKPQSLSQQLEDLLVHPQELAERLANHEFDTYTPIPIGYLRREAFAGTMSRSEFRELVIQDFFKSAARLYRDSTPFTASWKLALNHYLERKFLAFTGDPFNKSVVFEDIEQLRWRLQHAHVWFANNKQIRPLYPSQYFDVTRTEKREVGFEYTKTAWAKHIKWLEQKDLRKKRAEMKSEIRKRNINHAKKAETEIRRFLADKITLEQLHDYVERNLPAEFLEKLPEMILKLKDRRKA